MLTKYYRAKVITSSTDINVPNGLENMTIGRSQMNSGKKREKI